jgi:hypothetical protein
MASPLAWERQLDGSVAFDTPNGPMLASGADAAAEAARRDAANGVSRPLDEYHSIARGDPAGGSLGAGGAPPDGGMGGAGGGASTSAPSATSAELSPEQPAPRPSAWSGESASASSPAEMPTTTAAPSAPPPVSERLSAAWGKAKDRWDRLGEEPRQHQLLTSDGKPAAATAGRAAGAAGTAVDPSRVITGTDARAAAPVAGGGGSGGSGAGNAAKEARVALDEATRYQQGSAEAAEQSRLAGDARQADALRAQNEIDAKYQAQREERMRVMEERSRQFEEKIGQSLADVDKMKIDPGRWMASRTTGQRVLMTIGAALSGFGGGSNATLDMINRSVDNDIRSQIENRDAKMKQASAAQALYKDYLATFKDHDEAMLATATTAKLGIAKQAMQQALEVGSPEQIARAQELQSKLLEQQAAQYAQLAQQRAAAAAKASAGGAAAPKKGKDHFSGEIVKDTTKRREGSREAQAALRRMQERDKRPFSTWSPAERAADQADRTRYTSGWSAMFGEGVTNEGNLKRTDDTFGQSAIGSRDQAIKNELEDARQRELRYTEMLRRHGADPEVD